MRDCVRRALEEDAAGGDRTTGVLVAAAAKGRARITAKATGVISGQRAAEAVFTLLDEGIEYLPLCGDGSIVRPGDSIATVAGSARALLSGERTALNFLQHLSGIATLTARYVDAVKGTGVVILDTRKTTPGLRVLEKRAVADGGGRNHRIDLAGAILVKENHITAAGGLDRLIERLGRDGLGEAIVEISDLEQLAALRATPPARIMLDNFTAASVAAAIKELASWKTGAPEVEVSGGITLETVHLFAIPGVHYLSIGSLTSSAPALDLSMIIEEVEGS
jgi:nicotinate-nucleotide pyrophosphorylase (carboxylating)